MFMGLDWLLSTSGARRRTLLAGLPWDANGTTPRLNSTKFILDVFLDAAVLHQTERFMISSTALGPREQGERPLEEQQQRLTMGYETPTRFQNGPTASPVRLAETRMILRAHNPLPDRSGVLVPAATHALSFNSP